MTVFLDSSALVKRYAAEDHADQVRALTDVVVMSAIARVEVPAAFWRKHRLGELSAEDSRLLAEQFIDDQRGSAAALVAIEVGPDVLDRAAALVARHPLRAYDAVQLASALVVRDVIDGTRFGCFDSDLSAAAAAEGLAPAWA